MDGSREEWHSPRHDGRWMKDNTGHQSCKYRAYLLVSDHARSGYAYGDHHAFGESQKNLGSSSWITMPHGFGRMEARGRIVFFARNLNGRLFGQEGQTRGDCGQHHQPGLECSHRSQIDGLR